MSTRGAIKIREKGEELRLFYGHDAYPKGLGHQLRRYLNSANHQWKAMRIYKDLCDGKCMKGSFDHLCPDHDFQPAKEFGYYEEYGYLIDCDARRLVCYDLPGYPAIEDHPNGNTDDDDWSQRKVVDLPYTMVSEDETTRRIKAAVSEYIFGREKPTPFSTSSKVGQWSVHISVEFDGKED